MASPAACSSSLLLATRPRWQRAALTAHFSTLPAFLLPSWNTAASTQQQASGSRHQQQPCLPSTSRSVSSLSTFFTSKTGTKQIRTSALFPHPKESQGAIDHFRDRIGARDVYGLHGAYSRLVQAFRAHRRYLRRTAAAYKVEVPIGHARHDFQLRKSDLQTAIRTILRTKYVGRSRRALREQDAQLSRRMFRDSVELFGFTTGPSDWHYQLWTYCAEDERSKHYKHPVEAFRAMRAQFPDWKTTSVDWNLVLTALAKKGDLESAQELWGSMPEEGVERGVQAKNTMISLYFSCSQIEKAEGLLRLLGGREEMGIDSLTVAVDGYTAAIRAEKDDERRQDYARKARRYATSLKQALEQSPFTSIERAGWLTLFRYEGFMLGPDVALQTARKAYRPDLFQSRTVSHLLMLHEKELEELQTSDEALALVSRIEAIDRSGELRADRVSYSILILSLLGRPPTTEASHSRSPDGKEDSDKSLSQPDPNQVREAQLLYDSLLARGIVPDTTMISPLISAYCNAFIPSLPSAMKLFGDLLGFGAVPEPVPLGDRPNKRSIKPVKPYVALDTEIFNALLGSCVKMSDVDTTRVLLRKMDEFNVKVDASSKVHAATLLMKISEGWSEAFEIYRSVAKLGSGNLETSSAEHEGSGYDANGYTALLEVYRKLDFSSVPGQALAAPPEYLLQIVRDMRRAGYNPTCAIYTSLLDYYGKSWHNTSFAGVWATHEIIKQDERIEPDMPLINALMNAYSRAGAPGSVFSIWGSLIANRQEVDGATLAIALDTAGRQGMLHRARGCISAVRRLEKEKNAPDTTAPGLLPRRKPSAMNKGAWDAWLECLARCDHLEEAVELVFGSMPKQLAREAELTGAKLTTAPGLPTTDEHGQIIGPDSKTLQMLLKFAARDRDIQARQQGTTPRSSTWHEVRARVKEEMPWLWPDVEEIGVKK